jgi:hypothetical protein
MQSLDILRLTPYGTDFLDRKTGSKGEILYDSETGTVRIYSGDVAGGIALLRADLENVEGSLGATPGLTPPAVNVRPGNLWFNTANGKLFVYYNDGTSSQWVQSPSFYFGSAASGITAINFPNSPTPNQTYTDGATTWKWTGVSWEISNVTALTLSTFTATTQFVGNLQGNVTGNVVGNLQGNVTGQVSTISNHNLNDLGDVVSTAPTNAQVLAWSTANNRWEPLSFSGFSGGTVPNPILLTSTAVSTNSTSGALRVSGGVGILDDLYVGGHMAVEDEFLSLRTRSELRFFETDNNNYIGFKAPATISSNIMWTLPSVDGDAGQFLRTNGAGVLSWASAGGGPGGSTPPGGSNTHIQYNDVGAFGGDGSFTFDAATTTVNIPTLIGAGVATFTNSTTSTTATTGAVKVTGGVGIQGQLNVAGATNKFTASTASSSPTTGAVVITGGLGVGGSVNVNGTVSTLTSPTTAAHLTTKSYVDSAVLAFSIAFGV